MSKDEIVREYVCRPSSVAVVGASPKEDRPVSGVMQYCMAHGFRVFPVNPQYAGSEILGQPCRADLRELPVVPDIVALFEAERVAIEGRRLVRVVDDDEALGEREFHAADVRTPGRGRLLRSCSDRAWVS